MVGTFNKLFMIQQFIIVIIVVFGVLFLIAKLAGNNISVITNFFSTILTGVGLLIYVLVSVAAFVLAIIIAIVLGLSNLLIYLLLFFAVFSLVSVYFLINGLGFIILRSLWVLAVPLFIVWFSQDKVKKIF